VFVSSILINGVTPPQHGKLKRQNLGRETSSCRTAAGALSYNQKGTRNHGHGLARTRETGWEFIYGAISVAKVTIAVGLILIGLGLGGYFGTGTPSVTALIPAFFGGPILLLGVLALKDGMRKHAMHTAVLLGLIGFLASAGRAIAVLAKGEIKLPVALAMTIAMAVVCGIFVALCIRSFVQARRAREAKKA
jgi:hypothetical protein